MDTLWTQFVFIFTNYADFSYIPGHWFYFGSKPHFEKYQNPTLMKSPVILMSLPRGLSLSNHWAAYIFTAATVAFSSYSDTSADHNKAVTTVSDSVMAKLYSSALCKPVSTFSERFF